MKARLPPIRPRSRIDGAPTRSATCSLRTRHSKSWRLPPTSRCRARPRAAWDALAKVGGIGAVDAINMMYEMGKRMGEDKFVSNGANGAGTCR